MEIHYNIIGANDDCGRLQSHTTKIISFIGDDNKMHRRVSLKFPRNIPYVGNVLEITDYNLFAHI